MTPRPSFGPGEEFICFRPLGAIGRPFSVLEGVKFTGAALHLHFVNDGADTGPLGARGPLRPGDPHSPSLFAVIPGRTRPTDTARRPVQE